MQVDFPNKDLKINEKTEEVIRESERPEQAGDPTGLAPPLW